MPRRAGMARKEKYTEVPVNRTTARFHAKLMSDGKRRLAERILRQALARAEASARRPGIELSDELACLRVPEAHDRLPGSGCKQLPVSTEHDRQRTDPVSVHSRDPLVSTDVPDLYLSAIRIDV